MDYKKGYLIKPYQINPNGEVRFTDGTNNDLIPNKQSCEAYGYNFDESSGTCRGFRFSSALVKNMGNIKNKVEGGRAQVGVENSLINGSENEIKTSSRNALITGAENEITENIENSSIIGGRLGMVLRQGEVLIGGGGYNSAAGLIQMSFFQCSNKSTSASAVILAAQGEDTTTNYIVTQKNSILGFEAYVTGLVTGGSSGTAGDYIYIRLYGAVRTNNSLSHAISQSQTTIASLGTTGTVTMVSNSDQLAIQATGAANINISWSASVYLHENTTNATTF
tara:strand:- start:318 stop:1157 length:840 start_codon:yes stop_codon:yes gene_type:complete